jgi:3-oxoacyl-[acyl-carrier protein] reductase
MRVIFDGAGDVIVITGGANGIGRALALAAAETGARVVICDVDDAAMADVVCSNPRMTAQHLDVSDRAAVLATIVHIERDIGAITGLVCAGAVQPRGPAALIKPETWHHVLGVNLDGVLWCYQAVIPFMSARRRGSIIAFSSGLAQNGWPEAAAYGATKGALTGFVRTLAKEAAPYRVRINLIAPGVIETPQYLAANEGADDARWRASVGVGLPEDVVGPLLFLLSDAATMTGSLLSRDMAFAKTEPVLS